MSILERTLSCFTQWAVRQVYSNTVCSICYLYLAALAGWQDVEESLSLSFIVTGFGVQSIARIAEPYPSSKWRRCAWLPHINPRYLGLHCVWIFQNQPTWNQHRCSRTGFKWWWWCVCDRCSHCTFMTLWGPDRVQSPHPHPPRSR